MRQVFENTNVKIEVIKGQDNFEREYPCLAAVNRCASTQPRHDGRVIWLTYEPEVKRVTLSHKSDKALNDFILLRVLSKRQSCSLAKVLLMTQVVLILRLEVIFSFAWLLFILTTYIN